MVFERRSFLKAVAAFGAAICAWLVGRPVLRALLWPIRSQPSSENWVKVAEDVALVDIGKPIRLDFVQNRTDAWVETRALNSVWLYTEDGRKFKAYNGHCTHLGCGFSYDEARKMFFCPCHRGLFDVKTGAVLDGPPPRALDELTVEVRDAAVFVKYQDFQLGVKERIEA